MKKQQYFKHHLGQLKIHLNSKYSKQTTDGYYRVIEQYLSIHPQAKNYQKSQIIDYINELRKHYKNPSTMGRVVHGLKAYYSFLKDTEQIAYNPIKTFKIKDKQRKQIQLQDLFTQEELDFLFTRKDRYKLVASRNKVLLGLLIYQGLRADELTYIKLSDIDFQTATIHIRKTRLSNERKLPLQASQMMVLFNYINQDREQLLKDNKSDKLLISKLGKSATVDSLTSFFKVAYKDWFSPRKVNLTSIRQSVIHNLLKEGKDLRTVQLFAGHKTPSTTERYKPSNSEKLKAKINKFHPLK